MPRSVTITNAEVALVTGTPTTVIPADACDNKALVFNKDASVTVYMTDDGSTPSSTNGMPLAPGTGYEWPSNALPQAAVKVIATGTPRVFSSWS